MKKNNHTTKTPKNKAQKAPRKARKARSAHVDPRWSFELGATEWGPFKTKGAKINSARSMVGLGERALDIQRKMPRLRTTINENGNTVDILTGTDFIKSVTQVGIATAGDILYKQEISPSAITGTRLLQFSQLYQRYRFRRISFIYEPIASATQSGQLLGFADFDVDNQINTNSTENLAIGAAHQGQAITQIWQAMEFDMGQVLTFTDLFTEVGSSPTDDKRMSIQGVFYLLAASQLPEATALGNLYVDYEVEFSIPYLSVASSLLERQSAGHRSGTVYLSETGNNISIDTSIDPAVGFGPAKLTTSGIGSRTILFENLSAGDQVDIMFDVRVGPNEQLAVLYQGTNDYRSLSVSNPIIEGGELLSVSVNQWRNGGLGSTPPFGGWGFMYFSFRATNSIASYVSIYNPGWTGNTAAPNGYTQLGQLTYFVTPRAELERQARIRARESFSRAPQELDSLRQQMSALTKQLATLVDESSAKAKDDDRRKGKVAELKYPKLSASTSGSAHPQSPRAFSPNYESSPTVERRPRSSSMLGGTIPTRVSDEIAHPEHREEEY